MKNNGDVPLDPATRTFIDRMGIRFELDGLPRIAGQILGLMLVSPQPRSLDEIAQLVQVSKASVSSNTRLLERQGLVVRGARPGDRRDYYSVVTDLNARILEHRLGVMREMRSILEIGLETPGAADAAIRDRLTCATTCLGEAIEELTARAARAKAEIQQASGALLRRAEYESGQG